MVAIKRVVTGAVVAALLTAQPVLGQGSAASAPWRIQRLSMSYEQEDLDQIQTLLASVYRQRRSIGDVVAYASRRGAECGPVYPTPQGRPGEQYVICKKHGGFLFLYEMRMVVTFLGPDVSVFADTDAEVP